MLSVTFRSVNSPLKGVITFLSEKQAFKQAVILRKKQLEDELIEEVKICKTTDELSKIWYDNVGLQKDAKFTQAFTNRKKQLENGNK